MKPRSTGFILFIILVFSFSEGNYLYAQNDPGKWNINFMGGIPFTYFNEGSLATPVTGLDINYKINPLISLQANFYKGTFKNKHETNFYGRTFHNSYWSAAIRPEFNLLRILNLGKITNTVGLLGFAGIGVLQNNVKTDVTNKIGGWRYFRGIDNRNAVLFYSFGTGLKFNLSRRVSFLIRYEYNFTNSDYIDGYTTVNDVNLTQVGKNNNSNDNYSFVSTGISINLGRHRKTNIERKVDDLEKYYQFDSDKIIMLEKVVKQNARQLNDYNQILKRLEAENQMDSVASKRELNRLHRAIGRIQYQIDSLTVLLNPVLNSRTLRKKEAKAESPGDRYYIVADSFLEMEKANKLITELKATGFPNAKMITDESHVWYLVTYNQAASRNQAQKMLSKIRNSYNPLAWLFVRKR